VSGPSAELLEGAAGRIERWLLDSGVQLRDGPQQGGVAGSLDRHGRPDFVYMEITGYYMTTMAWLAAGAASSEERATAALERGNQALDWMTSTTSDGAVPPTRLYLSPADDDWRNAAIFSFDLAMAARGVACFAAAIRTDEAETIIRALGARLQEVCSDTVPLRSHALRDGPGVSLPDRWSTRPGAHHLKAAAAVLRLPGDVFDEALMRACRETVDYWAAGMRSSWPSRELHPLLYGLEGLLILEPAPSEKTLDLVEDLYERLLQLQAPDGSLPGEAIGAARVVRADVLAQALRLGALLRAAQRLRGDGWGRRLDALAEALLRHVRADGGVLFSTDRDIANAWCAMFAHQALLLHSRAADGGVLAVHATDRLI
jgi:hypothetical protein